MRATGKGSRLGQNKIKVQQLKNSQFIITFPSMWASILDVKKGDVVTFLPGARGGIEVVKLKEENGKKPKR